MTEAEAYLNQIPMWATRKNSPEDIRDYLEELGNPDKTMKIIHVAGTNGKGSVCAFMTSVLKEAGYKVGTFVSPHLVEIRERFLMNGRMVRKDTFEFAFERVRKLSETMTEKGYQPPTYFEFLFYMSMVIYARSKPDFVILETGLGGRLDATNAIRNAVLTVITSVSMDHMQYLGDTLEKIAGEKAGILKPGVPVVYDDNTPAVSRVIIQRAKQLQCRHFPASVKDYSYMGKEQEQTRISVRTTDGGQLILDVPSEAEYQRMNVTLAVTALGLLKRYCGCRLEPGDVREGIRHCCWPGRMEQVLPQVYLDGAHNIGGIQAFVKTASQIQREKGQPIHLLFAVVSDKEYMGMIEELCRLPIAHVSIAHMNTGRGKETGVLVKEFQKYLHCPVTEFSDTEQAFHHFLAMRQKGEPAFCIGSLYLIGEIKQILRRKSHD